MKLLESLLIVQQTNNHKKVEIDSSAKLIRLLKVVK